MVFRRPRHRPLYVVGRRVTVYNSGLPGIDGESGYVTEYGSSIERYRVLLNNGHVYYLASHLLQLTRAPAEAVQLPPMQKHPPQESRPATSLRRSAPAALNRPRIKSNPDYLTPYRTRSEARLGIPFRLHRVPCLRNRPLSKGPRRRLNGRGSLEANSRPSAFQKVPRRWHPRLSGRRYITR